MKISVITVCYNAAAELEQTMLSVLEQTYPDVEYIVIDGGSTDGSVDIIHKYADRLAYWISEPDRGIYDAMNKGIAHATGQYLNFMNVGDRFVSSTVLEQFAAEVAGLETCPTILYGNTYKHDAKRRWEDLSHQPEVLKHHGAFCHQSAFVSVPYHQAHPFDLHFKYMADFNFFHKAYMSGATFWKLNLFVAEYNQEFGASLSQISQNYKELDEILADTDTPYRRIRRKVKHALGQLKRLIH